MADLNERKQSIKWLAARSFEFYISIKEQTIYKTKRSTNVASDTKKPLEVYLSKVNDNDSAWSVSFFGERGKFRLLSSVHFFSAIIRE